MSGMAVPQSPTLVIPAQAGIQPVLAAGFDPHWIPACAGMTMIKATVLAKGSDGLACQRTNSYSRPPPLPATEQDSTPRARHCCRR
jgi:hypothetical protein